MTTDLGYRWADHLVDQGVAKKSIRDVWIASLKATAGFMKERHKLVENPFAGIRIRGVKATKESNKKGFTDGQANKILEATLATPSHLTTPETRAARRWVPWIAPATIVRELNTISHAIEIASREWKLWVPRNPVKLVRRPPVPRGRARRLKEGEEDRLLAACNRGCSPLLKPLINLAIETGMRRGELLGLRLEHVDLATGRSSAADQAWWQPRGSFPFRPGKKTISAPILVTVTKSPMSRSICLRTVEEGWLFHKLLN
jgi:integrase